MEGYNIIEELGYGCFGTVYLVEDVITKTQYAMKEIQSLTGVGGFKETKERFEQRIQDEIDGTKLFHKYNIGPEIYNFSINYPTAYIIMDLFDVDLSWVLSNSPNLKLCEQLMYLYTQKERYKLYHRDLSEHNIMVKFGENRTEIKEVKFIDCAISTTVPEHQEFRKDFEREQKRLKKMIEVLRYT